MRNAMARHFSPVQTRRAVQDVVEQIAYLITDGDLRSGDRLPSERVLAEQMAVSRSTVREAISVLASAGVLEVAAAGERGVLVAADSVPWQVLQQGPALPVAEVGAVLEARRVVEPRVAQIAALRGTAEDFQVMERTIEVQRAQPEKRDLFEQQNWQFHMRMARATQNFALVELVRWIYTRLAVAMEMIRGHDQPAWSIDIHERTLKAIMRGDHADIEVIMDEHMAFLERIWEAETGLQGVRTAPAFLSGWAGMASVEGAQAGPPPARPDRGDD
jgi:DNA-binding FadR family transcriptional regulator